MASLLILLIILGAIVVLGMWVNKKSNQARLALLTYATRTLGGFREEEDEKKDV